MPRSAAPTPLPSSLPLRPSEPNPHATTKHQAEARRTAEREHHRQTQTAAEAASAARDMLEEMRQPQEGGGPQEMTELMNACALILANQREMRQEIAALRHDLRQLLSRPA